VDAFEIDNHLHVIVCTNEATAIHAEYDERRWVVIRVSSVRKEDTGYFAGLTDWFSNGGAEAVLAYLLAYDWSGVNLRIAPRTEALAQQKLHSLSLIERSIYSMLQTGMVSASREWEQPQERSSFVELINTDYRARWEFPVTVEQVGKRLHCLFPEVQVQRGSGKDRGRRWILPPLKDARGAFERYIGQAIRWDPETED
jgi:hypothetical protein